MFNLITKITGNWERLNMTEKGADYYIEKLKMEPHYEGGWFKFIKKSEIKIPRSVLGEKYTGDRASASLIYYLLKEGEVSTWHKLHSEEVWFWHAGGSLKMTLGGCGDTPACSGEIILGNNLDCGEQFQGIVPAGTWQTSTPCRGSEFVLVSCVVSPGFEDDDFVLPKKVEEGK